MDLEQRRLELNELFVDILGSRNVYFQPPASLVMQYPCIRYNREQADSKFASNKLYRFTQRYQATLIYRNHAEGSAIFQKIISLPMTVHDRSYAGDNLNHDVFTLYF